MDLRICPEVGQGMQEDRAVGTRGAGAGGKSWRFLPLISVTVNP